MRALQLVVGFGALKLTGAGALTHPDLYARVADFLSAAMHDILDVALGGDSPQLPLTLYQVAARGVVVYILGLALVRIGKNRMIGRVTSLDVILGFILGSLLSRAITGRASISATVVSSAAMVAAHWLVTKLACHWHAFGTLVKGHTVLVL